MSQNVLKGPPNHFKLIGKSFETLKDPFQCGNPENQLTNQKVVDVSQYDFLKSYLTGNES